ncbi:hypothetical protein LTR78_000925 [Recurvomyces mirabilis]|uniref:Zn-dependent exopeptidase n=1 Tax=Recurvomyces mirabilis TaxID=574656 RepID=A0AAE0WWQ5_9PEZI|nr:hypothetical protein LTR78_000925 [Recurvomyces mirabilis]KAK5158896.1 hypothetical protein LTS14_003004 [Recurvomyces mirabilis]
MAAGDHDDDDEHMMEDKYAQYANIPIPSYDEATASRSTSSQDTHDNATNNNTAEREGLLTYHHPTVESARTSLGFDAEDEDEEADDLRLPEVNGHNNDIERRQIEELDYLDPSYPDSSRRSPRLYHRVRIRSGRKWGRQLSSLGATLSNLRFPIPSFRSLYRPVDTDEEGEARPDTRTWLSRFVSRVGVPERYRLSGPTAARLAGLFTLLTFIYFLFAFDLFPGSRRGLGNRFDPEAVRRFVLEHTSGENIRQTLEHITSFDHVAGTEGDLYLAKWMEGMWTEQGVFDQVALLPYHVYLNYPGERGVEIMRPEGARWTARLEEEQAVPGRVQIGAWQGHSWSGEVEGHLVYANGGSWDDYAWLRENGVVVNGSVALVNFGGTQADAGWKLRAAQEAGCVGVLMYSSPSDVAEDSAWRPPDDMVQRGDVGMGDWVLGDPLTPGFASHSDSKIPRLSMEGNRGLPSIPSLPLAWRDAKDLIKALDGHGASVPFSWVHWPGDGLDKHWFSGTAEAEDADVPIVHLKNMNDENPLQEIWNLHGMMEGLEQPQKKILVGNHRDAWCFGAVSPGSGSAVMMEVVRIFGELKKLNWRPLRTIEFVSFDAGEYNNIGSTEYVEDTTDFLRENALAYINVDTGVFGDIFTASGSPVWERPLLHVLDRISAPETNDTLTLKQKWAQHSSAFQPLGHASDYAAFQSIAGTSSLDFSFVAGTGAREKYFPYNSCHDTLAWMETYGDPTPDFAYHSTLAQIWTLLILELADRPMIPYDIRSYAAKLQTWTQDLERHAAGLWAQQQNLQHASAGDLQTATGFTVNPLTQAIAALTEQANTFHKFEETWTSNVLASGGLETRGFAAKRLEYNNRLARFETDLLDLQDNAQCPHGGGMPGRCQFKHSVFGPVGEDGVGGGVGIFPFVRDAMERGEWEKAGVWVGRVAGRVREAGRRIIEGN